MRIGDIDAHCPKCGATAFRAASSREPGLTCLACGTTTPRAVLVDQIARESIERTEQLLRDRRKPP